MHMYLCAKFQVSSIILSSFRQGEGREGNSPTLKPTPKKTTHIWVKELCYNSFNFNQMKLRRILQA